MTADKLHLLMVDDDALLLEVVSEELRDRGHHVSTLSDPQQTIEQLNNKSVDLLLLDLKMPNISGISLLEEIQDLHPELPVIILTGHGDVGSASAAMRYGAMDYFQKPVLIEKLEKAIQQAISKRGTAETRNKKVMHLTDGKGNEMLHQIIGILCNNCPVQEESTANGILPLMSVDDYHHQVILQHQHSLTESELAKRLGFSRDKLWRTRKKLGIPRK